MLCGKLGKNRYVGTIYYTFERTEDVRIDPHINAPPLLAASNNLWSPSSFLPQNQLTPYKHRSIQLSLRKPRHPRRNQGLLDMESRATSQPHTGHDGKVESKKTERTRTAKSLSFNTSLFFWLFVVLEALNIRMLTGGKKTSDAARHLLPLFSKIVMVPAVQHRP